MSRLQTLSDYEREIQELEKLIADQRATADQLGDDRLFADLAIQSLESRRRELIAELERLADDRLPGQELYVTLTGKPVVRGSIDLDFLALIAKDIQNLIRSAFAAITGRKTRGGRLRDEVVRRSTVRLAGVYEGSFGLRLEAIDEQLALEWPDEAAPLAVALESLFGVLEGQADRAAFLAALALMGGRAASHYRELLEHLTKHDATMQVYWPRKAAPRKAELRSTRAASILDAMRLVEQNEYGRYIWGTLDGAITRRRYFELIADDGTIFAGSISADIMQDVRQFFDRRCRAFITTTETRDKGTGDVKRHHRLLELAEADAPIFADDQPEEGP